MQLLSYYQTVLKHHLASTRKTVESCRVDLYEVRQQMLDIVHKFQRNHINKITSSEYIEINMEGGKGKKVQIPL